MIRTVSTPSAFFTPQTTLTAPTVTKMVANPKALAVYKAALKVSSAVGSAFCSLLRWEIAGLGCTGRTGERCPGKDPDLRGGAEEFWRDFETAFALYLRNRTIGTISVADVTANYTEKCHEIRRGVTEG